MPHLQQQVLEQVRTTLVAGATAAAGRVFVDRVDPLQPSELPAILIDEGADGEQVEPFTIGGVDQRRLAVQVSCVVTHGSAAAAQARDLGLAVEQLMQASLPLAAMCRLGVQLNASRPQISGEGDRLIASRDQLWSLSYAALSASPDTLF